MINRYENLNKECQEKLTYIFSHSFEHEDEYVCGVSAKIGSDDDGLLFKLADKYKSVCDDFVDEIVELFYDDEDLSNVLLEIGNEMGISELQYVVGCDAEILIDGYEVAKNLLKAKKKGVNEIEFTFYIIY